MKWGKPAKDQNVNLLCHFRIKIYKKKIKLVIFSDSALDLYLTEFWFAPTRLFCNSQKGQQMVTRCKRYSENFSASSKLFVSPKSALSCSWCHPYLWAISPTKYGRDLSTSWRHRRIVCALLLISSVIPTICFVRSQFKYVKLYGQTLKKPIWLITWDMKGAFSLMV